MHRSIGQTSSCLVLEGGLRLFVIAELEELAGRRGGESNVLERQNCVHKAVGGWAYLIDTTSEAPLESPDEVMDVLESRGWV